MSDQEDKWPVEEFYDSAWIPREGMGEYETLLRFAEAYAAERTKQLEARVKELREAAKALEMKLALLLPKIDAVIVMQSVRAGHNTWTHGSLADELERTRKALEAFK